MAESAYADLHWVDEDPLEAMPPTSPTQDELPCDDGAPMETQRHKWQMDLLIEAVHRWLLGRGERQRREDGGPPGSDAGADTEYARAEMEWARAERAEQELVLLRAPVDGKG